jgi:hypothetical protein
LGNFEPRAVTNHSINATGRAKSSLTLVTVFIYPISYLVWSKYGTTIEAAAPIASDDLNSVVARMQVCLLNIVRKGRYTTLVIFYPIHF